MILMIFLNDCDTPKSIQIMSNDIMYRIYIKTSQNLPNQTKTYLIVYLI
jgi:hypothetical protein